MAVETLSGPRAATAARWDPPTVQWVVKASKLCNLRCRYCYEFPDLGDRTRMTEPQLRGMFAGIAAEYAGQGRRMDFVWHGGEPLLNPPSFYETVARLQEEELTPAGVSCTNSVQTNLTRLRPETIELLRGFFVNVGVSLDLFGDQRVTVAGRPVERQVIENMQRLKELGIRFGCITVLSQRTLPHVARIYEFFEEIDTSFRLLPIYRTGYEGQHDGNAVTPAEIRGAFEIAVDRWLVSESSIQVRPIQDYIRNVVRHHAPEGLVPEHYSKAVCEVVHIVDTDGSLYSNGDAYDPRYCHGNLFTEPLAAMRRSAGYRRALAESEQRMADTCAGCEYHGACSGYFMAECTPEQRLLDAHGRHVCGVVRPMHAYISRRLREVGVIDADGRLRLDERAQATLFAGELEPEAF